MEAPFGSAKETMIERTCPRALRGEHHIIKSHFASFVHANYLTTYFVTYTLQKGALFV
jgi:hypothetical protein